jgi:hypothetical protein
MDMFKEPFQNIIHAIRTIFQHERCSDVSAIMMVGGFSEADVLQNAVQKAFSDIEVFIPVESCYDFSKCPFFLLFDHFNETVWNWYLNGR